MQSVFVTISFLIISLLPQNLLAFQSFAEFTNTYQLTDMEIGVNGSEEFNPERFEYFSKIEIAKIDSLLSEDYIIRKLYESLGSVKTDNVLNYLHLLAYPEIKPESNIEQLLEAFDNAYETQKIILQFAQASFNSDMTYLKIGFASFMLNLRYYVHRYFEKTQKEN